jgi:hypothetical protein
MSGHILVDIDCTLAIYDGNFEEVPGPPVQLMLDRVKAWLGRGIEVRIFTARASVPELIPPIEEWCLKYIGHKLKVTNSKDFGTIEIWDDRAVRVKPNTGIVDLEYTGIW